MHYLKFERNVYKDAFGPDIFHGWILGWFGQKDMDVDHDQGSYKKSTKMVLAAPGRMLWRMVYQWLSFLGKCQLERWEQMLSRTCKWVWVPCVLGFAHWCIWLYLVDFHFSFQPQETCRMDKSGRNEPQQKNCNSVQRSAWYQSMGHGIKVWHMWHGIKVLESIAAIFWKNRFHLNLCMTLPHETATRVHSAPWVGSDLKVFCADLCSWELTKGANSESSICLRWTASAWQSIEGWKKDHPCCGCNRCRHRCCCRCPRGPKQTEWQESVVFAFPCSIVKCSSRKHGYWPLKRFPLNLQISSCPWVYKLRSTRTCRKQP